MSSSTRAASRAMALCSLLAACSSASDLPGEMTLGPPIVLGGPERSYQPAAEGDALLLARATDMVSIGDTLVILDNGNSRLVFADTTFGLLHFAGSEGSGPGELRGALYVAAAAGKLFVSEISNGRISVFTMTGRFERSQRVTTGAAPFAVMADQTILSYARDGSWLFNAIGKDGSSSPLVRIAVADDTTSGPDRFDRMAAPLVAIDEDDDIHVFDNESGVLFRYSPSGDHLSSRRLPDTVLAAIRLHQEKVAKAFGTALLAQPMAKCMRFTPDGQLLLLLVGDTPGLVIDPTSDTARPIVVDHITSDHVKNASAAAFIGSSMHTLANDAIYATRWPGSADVIARQHP